MPRARTNRAPKGQTPNWNELARPPAFSIKTTAQRMRAVRLLAGLTRGELAGHITALSDKTVYEEDIAALEEGRNPVSGFVVTLAVVCGVRTRWIFSSSLDEASQ